MLLPKNNITDSSVIPLIEFLNRKDNIISLNLDNNKITDTGAAPFAAFLKGNTSILSFHIQNNDIKLTGDALFKEVIKSNTTLASFLYTTNLHETQSIKLSDIESLEILNRNSNLHSCSALATTQNTTLYLRTLAMLPAAETWLNWRKNSTTVFPYNNFTQEQFQTFFHLANAIKLKLSNGEFSNLAPKFHEELSLAYTKAASVSSAVEFYCCASELPNEIAELILMAVAVVQTKGFNTI